jgi:hypothetical protein
MQPAGRQFDMPDLKGSPGLSLCAYPSNPETEFIHTARQKMLKVNKIEFFSLFSPTQTNVSRKKLKEFFKNAF